MGGRCPRNLGLMWERTHSSVQAAQEYRAAVQRPFADFPLRRPLTLILILLVWVGHSCPTPLTLLLTVVRIVILRKRSRTLSGRLPTKDLCNLAAGPI
jgi:hypothetical protein